MLLSSTYNQTSIQEIKNNFVVKKVREIVQHYDKHAEIILFGSRARGDWNEESDWDFLILSTLDEESDAKEKIRTDVLEQIEYKISVVIFVLFHNSKVWEEKYSVTPLYYNIKDEGIFV